MYHDKFKVGDKLIYGTAVKGVDKDVFPEGLEPYSEYRKDEKIHALLSILSKFVTCKKAGEITPKIIATAIVKKSSHLLENMVPNEPDVFVFVVPIFFPPYISFPV